MSDFISFDAGNNFFDKTIQRLKHFKKSKYEVILQRYGEIGVQALMSSTPKRTGKTASSWYYNIEHKGSTYKIIWSNSYLNEGTNIALIIQYGHGTGSGGYVSGIDYINPVMKPIFKSILNEIKNEVRNG